MSWKNASIQSKIIFTGVFVVIMFTAAVFFYFIPSMKNAIIETKKEKIRDIIDCAAFTIEGMYRDYQEGKISEETFKNNVIDYVRNVRYGPGGRDYLWLNDLEPKMIFHPYRSDLNGKNIAEHKDPSGKQFFIEMVNICRASGGGFVQYMWQYKDDTTKIVPKISYVRLISSLNWIIGTGVYELDIYEEIQARVHTLEARIGLVVAAITIVLVLFVFFISRSIKQNIGRCVHTVKLLSEGDLTQRVELDQKDEIGQMAAALDSAIDDIEKLISSIILSSQNLAQAVEQISAVNHNLSQRTNQQATSIE
jgi:methyl-accepting chemotaxis protein